MRTVVPIGGNVTPALLLGWASADFSAAETECVAVVVHGGDGARQRDPLKFGTQAHGRAPAEQ